MKNFVTVRAMKILRLLVVCVLFFSASITQAATFSHELLVRNDAHRCSWFDRWTHFVIAERCKESSTMPRLSIDEAVESVRPYIKDVRNIYSIEEEEFYYADADIVYDEELIALVSYREDRLNRSYEKGQSGYINLPKAVLWYKQLQQRSSFASVRDTSTYDPCRKTNYDIAMDQLNWVVVQPGELLNMNKKIARLPWYCRGAETFLFYQWVCWGSTQLFWNGMINPFLEVTKRSAHGMWYAWFYGSDVMGDDASMYEWWKQLEVKNIGDKPLYMMTFDRADWNTVLLSIYPGVHDMRSFIKKQQTGKRSAVVSSTVFDKYESIVYSQERVSNYWWIDNSIDETAPLYSVKKK